MHTQDLNSRLGTASRWGLTIDSESQPYGNAGEASRNVLRFLLERISLSVHSAWTLFTSAFVSDTTVRDALIQSIHNHANSNVSGAVFPERYDTRDNSWRNGLSG